jgi:sporadic carbohydrate cluster 2OG-Fe(II) oxygenase
MINFDDFKTQGYFTHSFSQLSALTEIKRTCENIARAFFGEKFTTLDKYHEINIDESRHEAFQYAVFNQLNKDKKHRQFVTDNLAFFTAIFGADLDVQTNLYIRIARPNQSLDNIGIHRDTDYGNSAYELSLSLPLVSQVKGCGLNVIPKSHLFSERNIKQFNREDVDQGAPKNQMGFLYAPKKILDLDEQQLKCISLPFGSGLGFTLGLIHGQTVNNTHMTRWAIDFRVKNTFHPLTKNLKEGYYTPLNSSAIQDIAKDYYQINVDEKSTLNNQT